MRFSMPSKRMIGCMVAFLFIALCSEAQTPSRALLVLEKDGNKFDIIDPASLKIVAKIPAGQDPHEVIASADGKLACLHFELWRGANTDIQTSFHIIGPRNKIKFMFDRLNTPLVLPSRNEY